MNISKVKEYITRSHKELKNLSKKGEGNIVYLWFDFIRASLIHKAILNHYCRGELYKLAGCERKKSMTYGRIVKAFDQCNDPKAIPVLNNKDKFNAHFSSFVKRRWHYSPDMNFEQFSDLCDCVDNIIIKPSDGVEGADVIKARSPKTVTDRKALFKEATKRPSMVEECIASHPDMVFGNSSVNTIRVHAILDKEGNVHIFKCILRAGVGNTVVDNYARGGVIYEVDSESGRIISPGYLKVGNTVYFHPGTEYYMLGRQIPLWDSVLETVKAAHKTLPNCRFIGWDVAITNEGALLIEGNHNPDYELLEFLGTKGWYEKLKQFI